MIVTWANSLAGPAFILGLGPAAWYRLGMGITVVTGVSAWADQSGNNRPQLQAVGASQPALQGDGSILYDGVDDFTQANFPIAQPCTFFLRLKQVSWTSNDYFCDGGSAAPNSAVIVQNNASPQIRAQGATGNTANSSSLVVGTYGSLACVYNGASSALQVNSDADLTANLDVVGPTGFTLACFGGGTLVFSNIQVKEAIVYPTALNRATRDRVIAYLNGI